MHNFDDQIHALFGGRHEISGGTKKYELAYKYLTEDANTVLKAVSCLVVYEKSRSFLFLGNTKDLKVNKALDPKVANILPRHDDGFFDRLKDSPLAQDKITLKKRLELPTEFQTINFTCVKTVALMFLQASFMKKVVYGSFHRDFIVKHPSSPYSGHCGESEFKNSETFKIRNDAIKKFSNERSMSEPIVQKLIVSLP